MKKGQTLSLKERRFVDAYLGTCNGNASAAVRAAGYGARTQKSQQVQGSQLLSKPIVRALIEQRNAKATEKGVADALERDTRLSGILRQNNIELGFVISAIKELNKCSGRHSIKHVLDVTEKLSDIIAASRASV